MRTSGDGGALTVTECVRALRSVPTGRLLYTEDALPAVRLVTFAAPRSEIVIATENDDWFGRFDRMFVAFEAGRVESGTRAGWSVVVLGHARIATGSEYPSGFDHSGLAPWTVQSSDGYLVLDIEDVTGRRMTLPRLVGDHR
ncbi:pyridoxamine 5'-phosphate oxidase family protein [Rhodococcus wratislaviensis]|uniref:pyridoxamine 5'-phosphate oxidase family protein n=1 Tax=Rhodococcus wratislaviensis TaxID=44752 RepID=UPI00365BFC70